jgi:hypothetical protein
MITGVPEGDQVCGVGQADGKPYCVSTATGAIIPTPDVGEDGTVLRLTSVMTAGRVILGRDLRHYCGITAAEGAMYCWGENTFGQLGRDTNGGWVDIPMKVSAPALSN